MPDGIDTRKGANEVCDLRVLGVAVPPLDVAVGNHLVVGSQEAQLEAGRPGVDD